MKLHETAIPGAYRIELDPKRDERGVFARIWCARTFAEHGLSGQLTQCSLSVTETRGIIRGLHYQKPPAQETKLVRCVRGAIFDVIVDVRPDSPAYGQWHAETLRAGVHTLLYVPAGCAHGFQTLADDTEVNYWMSAPHAPDAEAGIRYDDPTLAIPWPLPVAHLSDRDRRLGPLAGRAGA
ncbi:dTDP-4-dehydrorhamnose 3,5-epimerase [Limimonas halophila]|uniref:dTDP-4-dehydrorhamnose 3,5-epimerase n=1 Tax=Limimonas halophila TaxID=1082479 RepID=A0A1G7Q9D9_9PROT|nr:dTDP-4-dehydrorhamnose 3,5-epimerase family protein [Limimonas halophila]SDF94200.1 dTDP-4-dehydrorhamnose 3,5-epimerase [Limimonas halophila]